MAIYELKNDELIQIGETSFSAENILERRNIQQLLRRQIGVLSERLMVIAEEFGDWLDSSRRIDLLCLDTDANLVVVELKRSDDGGHMELQALRYAAMISAMTFDQLVETHARYLNASLPDNDAASAAILDFLHWTAPNEDNFGRETRIILASANFSKELTTAVLWLIDRGIDIRCVRLKPHRMNDGPLLLDIQQIIPLPETANFQTQIGVKRQAERKGRSEGQDIRYKFFDGLLAFARQKTPIHANRSPTTDSWIAGGIGRSGFSISYVTRETDSQVELWISHGKGRAGSSLAAFQQLQAEQQEIEAAFGGQLEWMELPEREACRIRYVIEGGWRSPPDTWNEIFSRLVDAMIRLHAALRERVLALKL